MKQIIIKIKGMHCKSCETLIKDSLEEQEGVSYAKVSSKNNKAKIKFDESKIDSNKLKKIIINEGYGVE